MCLAAALWSRLDAVYFAADRHDAAAAEFDDVRIYEAVAGKEGEVTLQLAHIPLDSRTAPFDVWRAKPDRIPY